MTKSVRPYRRRKVPLVDPHQLGLTVHGRNKARWEDLAEFLKVSPSELFDTMVENLQVDEYGRPVWFPKPMDEEDGMLRMPAA